jgi:hypothetical protein
MDGPKVGLGRPLRIPDFGEPITFTRSRLLAKRPARRKTRPTNFLNFSCLSYASTFEPLALEAHGLLNIRRPSGIIVAGNSYHWLFSYSYSVKRYSYSKRSIVISLKKCAKYWGSGFPEKVIDSNRFRRFRVRVPRR